LRTRATSLKIVCRWENENYNLNYTKKFTSYAKGLDAGRLIENIASELFALSTYENP
jgi:hypothetical protein